GIPTEILRRSCGYPEHRRRERRSRPFPPPPKRLGNLYQWGGNRSRM
ncbi:MAG: hypothetical protein AVDCRST_MAG83-3574, partial [uncultured Arthrobacter sp.]